MHTMHYEITKFLTSESSNRIRKSGAAGGGGYREDDDVDDTWDIADVKASDPSLRLEPSGGKNSSSSKGGSLHVERL